VVVRPSGVHSNVMAHRRRTQGCRDLPALETLYLSVSHGRLAGWLLRLLLVLLADVTNSYSHHCKPRQSIHLHLGRAEFTPRKIRRRAATDAAPLAI
jgi:hypothetical protein